MFIQSAGEEILIFILHKQYNTTDNANFIDN